MRKGIATIPMRPPTKRRGKRAGVVLDFVPRYRGPAVDHDTVRELELLLRHARLGHIDGLAWIVSVPQHLGGKPLGDTTGTAARDAKRGSELVSALLRKVQAVELARTATK